MHATIKEVTEDLENFKFNTAIASLMEFVNTIYHSGQDEEILLNLIILLSPFVPHFSEELWQRLGNAESIFRARWPKYDPAMLAEEKVTIVIQVNGKVRSKIEVPADISEDRLKGLVLSDEKLKPWLQNNPPKNFILVPKKLVNIVV